MCSEGKPNAWRGKQTYLVRFSTGREANAVFLFERCLETSLDVFFPTSKFYLDEWSGPRVDQQRGECQGDRWSFWVSFKIGRFQVEIVFHLWTSPAHTGDTIHDDVQSSRMTGRHFGCIDAAGKSFLF